MEGEQNNTSSHWEVRSSATDGTTEPVSLACPEPVSDSVHMKPVMSNAGDSQPTASASFVQSQVSVPAVGPVGEIVSPAVDKMNITEYLSTEPSVLDAICAAAPPVVALSLYEAALSEQQLQCFR